MVQLATKACCLHIKQFLGRGFRLTQEFLSLVNQLPLLHSRPDRTLQNTQTLSGELLMLFLIYTQDIRCQLTKRFILLEELKAECCPKCRRVVQTIEIGFN